LERNRTGEGKGKLNVHREHPRSEGTCPKKKKKKKKEVYLLGKKRKERKRKKTTTIVLKMRDDKIRGRGEHYIINILN